MNKRFYPLIAFLVLAIAVMACASPLGDGGGQPSLPNQVETIVAATLRALTPVSSGGETPAPTSAIHSTSGGIRIRWCLVLLVRCQ